MNLEKIKKAIKENNSFLITSHLNLEGDSIGSQLALVRLLEYFGKRVVVVDEDLPGSEYGFLPYIKRIKRPKGKFKFDAVFVVDAADLKRIGSVSGLIADKLIINIDHHVSNSLFGDINLVKPEAESCCGIIYDVYKKLNVPIDKNTALLLYVGIATDTGFFKYSNTTKRTHQVVADLLRYKISPNKIYNHIYERASFSDMILVSGILKTLKTDKTGKIAWLLWNKKLNKKYAPSADLNDILLNFLRAIKGIEVAVLFKELEGKVRVNLRSQGNFDVNKLAKLFKGGGHKTASGCTLKTSLKIAENTVVKKAISLI